MMTSIQLPVDEQADAVADAVSDPNDIDSGTFSVAVDVFDNLLVEAQNNSEVSMCIISFLSTSSSHQ